MTNTPSELELARLKAEAAAAEAAAAQAKAEAAKAALDAALLASGDQPAPDASATEAADTAEEPPAPAEEPSAPAKSEPELEAESASSEQPAPTELSGYAAEVSQGYEYKGLSMTIGAYLEDDEPNPNALVRLPLAMLNRHGLVAGATGTGKTRTLQLLAEGLSDAGVAVFLTDIKGDLTGLLEPGASSEALDARTKAQGQVWMSKAFPVELFALGGQGDGVPIRATVTDFGPLLLAKVLGLNETQESALALMFHWADQQGLPLVNLVDLRTVVAYLTSDEGKDELKDIGGIATATAGVILREISALQAQGGDSFFGEPAFDPMNFIRTTADGRGVISALELPALQDRPALFSTFVMWLLAELFEILPEVGDAEKPKLVFFFDEAHLLFTDSSPEFRKAIVQTVRLIRSKGVGIFFVTQTPKDVPDDVLAQLGAKIQHALRAHTPNDQKALRQTVATFPTSPLDLEEVLPSLGTGEAIVTVLDPKGRPSPVAPTKLWAPAANMGTASPATVQATVAASSFLAQYKDELDPESAHEMLTARVESEIAQAEAERAAAEEAKIREAEAAAAQKEADRLEKEAAKAREREEREREKERERAQKRRQSTFDSMIKQAGRSITREITRSIFGNRRR